MPPDDVDPDGLEPAGDTAEDESSQPAVRASIAAAVCSPTISHTLDKTDFYILTIRFADSCGGWFAEDREKGGNYWDLTAPDYSQRNITKHNGFAGTGSKTLGAHFIRKVGWKSHRKLTLFVCAGSSCASGGRQWSYSVDVPLPD